MKHNVDDDTINEFFEYFKDVSLPNPEQYPLRFQFLIDSFVHYKNMKKGKQVATKE